MYQTWQYKREKIWTVWIVHFTCSPLRQIYLVQVTNDEFDFCVSMHHHIWVLLGPAWCKLFSTVFITLFALHVSDVIHIHPQGRAVGNQTRRGTGQLTRALTCTICMYILYRSWGWMCITSETCRANSVIKTTLNNLHQAGPNKTHTIFHFETMSLLLQPRLWAGGGGKAMCLSEASCVCELVSRNS